jgi:hypothetical protein
LWNLLDHWWSWNDRFCSNWPYWVTTRRQKKWNTIQVGDYFARFHVTVVDRLAVPKTGSFELAVSATS